MASLDVVYKDYDNLVKLLESDAKREDVYETIMNKEANVLQVMNRISNDKLKHDQNNQQLINMTIADFVMTFANTWRNIVNEFMFPQSYTQWREILFADDRKVYVGAMFVIISLVLFFVDISK